ncbi:MAG: hypothetical protein ACR2N4_07630 [Jatrophihabitans sp.]
MPPSVIGEKIAPRSLADLVEFENHVYARLFAEWVRVHRPSAAASIKQVLVARLLAQRPVDESGQPWPDARIQAANQDLVELYSTFRDGPLADLCAAMRDAGPSGLPQQFSAAAAERLAGSQAFAEEALDWFRLASELIWRASPTTAITIALDRLSAVRPLGPYADGAVNRGLPGSLLVGVWGLVEAELRRCLTACADLWRDRTVPLPEAAALAAALQAYGELAEQTVFVLPSMCEAALERARADAEVSAGRGLAGEWQATAGLIAAALPCSEIAVRLLVLVLYGCTPAFAPLAATATAAEGVSLLISQLPIQTLPEHRSLRRLQTRDLLDYQLVAAEHDPVRVDAARRELDGAVRRLAVLPNTPESYGNRDELRLRLQVLRRAQSGSRSYPSFG